MLPVAPATDCMASTSGTPAANMVDRVRAKRAIAALTRIGPMIGKLEHDPIHCELHLPRALQEVEERIEAAADHDEQPPALMLHEAR